MTLTFFKFKGVHAPPLRFPELERRYTARQLIVDKVFPVSEATLLRHARQHNIGKKFGRHVLFSRPDITALFEVLPSCSNSSSAPKAPTGSCAAPSGDKALKKLQALLTKKTAEEIRVKRENELMTESIWGKQKTTTFAHAALDYLEHGSGDGRFLKPLTEHFTTTPLRNINQHAIDQAAAKLYPKSAPSSRNRTVYTPMSAVLHHAARKGWCDTPFLSRPKQPKGKIRWIKPNEAENLIEACAPHLKPLVVFLLSTGARAGEALWLDWSSVNLDKGQVTFVKTKNGEPRSVPLHSRVVQLLASFKHCEGEVFLTHKGEPYSRPRGEEDASAGSRIKTAFAAACKRAKIDNFRVHDCRHTWATWHYQANHDLAALQALGGWKTVSMVLRYAHTNVEGHAKSIENLPWGKSGEKLAAQG